MLGDACKNEIRYRLFNHDLLIVWEPEYKLGIPIIDEQHRGILSTINSLHFGITDMHGVEMLRPVIEMVHDYTRIHFTVEEDFLTKYNYPRIKEHREMHAELISELDKVGRESLNHHAPLEFMEFLKKWWIDHICKEDREYLNYLMASLRG